MENIDIEVRKHKHIILGFDHYNTLGAVRSLGEVGIPVIAIIHTHINPNPHIVPNSKYASVVHFVDSLDDGYILLLKEYGNEQLKPFLYSCDDWVESLLDSHRDELTKKFFFFDGKDQGIVSKYMDKDEISKLAQECGCKIPKSETLHKGEFPKGLRYPIITKSIKSIVGGWKKDVRICYSKEELEKAYKTIESEELLVEEFIEKKNELCLDGFCINHGKDVCIPFQTTYLRVAPGKYGNYMELMAFDNKVVKEQVISILRKVGFNGIFSVEYLIDKDDSLYFLEVNFRNSTWSYAFTYGGVNMLYEWAKATLSGTLNSNTMRPRKTPFTAMVEPVDFKDFVLHGNVSVSQWLSDLKKTDCLFYYVKGDTKPIISHCKWVINKRIKKMFYKLIGKHYTE